MRIAILADIAARLMNNGKGELAMDESTGTCKRGFIVAGIPQTEVSRRAYRELLVCTSGLAQSISGVILFDGTIRQRATNGMLFTQVLNEAGIIPGIKVDLGAKPLSAHLGERVIEGLDSLRARLQVYHAMDARFSKWRAVFTVGAGLPTTACITANAHALARYAALFQEASLVQIVEPEVLTDGQHTLSDCADVTHCVLHAVFEQLDQPSVQLEGMILKCNMVLQGLTCPVQDDLDAGANDKLAFLQRSIPAVVAGVAFLSVGHPHGLDEADFDSLFTRDKPVIFGFHGYGLLVHRLTYRPTNRNFHVPGYKEEGTITTPFDMRVQNELDRFHLVLKVLDCLPHAGSRADYLKQMCRDKLTEHKNYIDAHVQDLPKILEWTWRASQNMQTPR